MLAKEKEAEPKERKKNELIKKKKEKKRKESSQGGSKRVSESPLRNGRKSATQIWRN